MAVRGASAAPPMEGASGFRAGLIGASGIQAQCGGGPSASPFVSVWDGTGSAFDASSVPCEGAGRFAASGTVGRLAVATWVEDRRGSRSRMPDPTRAMARAPVSTASGARQERRDGLLSWPSCGTESIAMQMPMLLVERRQASRRSSIRAADIARSADLLRSDRNNGSG
jgi:hypothetical protein